MSATRALLALGAALVLGVVNFSILGKERIKRHGETIFIDLAPRDPRSLVQGDYMALRFRLAQDIEAAQRASAAGLPREGESRLAEIAIDDRHIASLAKGAAPAPLHIRYRMRKDMVWLGTNAFFFEEGSEKRFAAARYGEFRLDRESGEAVLVGLRDAQLNAL
jgi:uncharacterized membrane-anchored protein